jgi:hypothetical protein
MNRMTLKMKLERKATVVHYSFPGSAWERAVPRLRLVASPATHK